MRRLSIVFAMLLAFLVSARPVDAATPAPDLLQPFVAELDVRLAALANATSPDEVELREQITALRVALVVELSTITDEKGLGVIKKVAGKIAKAFPGDAKFPAILKTALDGFAANIAELRGKLNTRINALADPALKAKAGKSLTKLDGLITAAAAVTDTKARAKALGKALAAAASLKDLLSKCPGHPGEFGHGQLVAFLGGTELFKPKFATGELTKDAGGQPLQIAIDGFHYPYEKGTIALTFTAPVQGNTYSFDQANLSGNYQKDNVYFFMESGTATIDEFDPVTRRIVAHFEFTGRDLGSGTTVTVSSGTLTVCEFKVTTAP